MRGFLVGPFLKGEEMDRSRISLIIGYAPLIIGITAAEILCFTEMGGSEDMTSGSIAIVVSLVSVAGSLLANFFQFRKDGNRIADINATASKMEPQVSNIREFAKETNDCVQGTVKHGVQSISEQVKDLNNDLQGKVNDLVEDLNYRKRIASESSGGYSRDYIVTGIDEVYKENLHLKELLRENEIHIHELEMERNINLSQISELKTQNSQLLSDLKKKDRNKSQGR